MGASVAPIVQPQEVTPGDYFVVYATPVTISYTFQNSSGHSAVCSFTVDVQEGEYGSFIRFSDKYSVNPNTSTEVVGKVLKNLSMEEG